MPYPARHPQKYRINFTDVTRGSIYYQCVYLSVAKDEGAMAAAATAREVFGITTGPYMPHLSLLYSDIPQEERAKVGMGALSMPGPNQLKPRTQSQPTKRGGGPRSSW